MECQQSLNAVAMFTQRGLSQLLSAEPMHLGLMARHVRLEEFRLSTAFWMKMNYFLKAQMLDTF